MGLTGELLRLRQQSLGERHVTTSHRDGAELQRRPLVTLGSFLPSSAHQHDVNMCSLGSSSGQPRSRPHVTVRLLNLDATHLLGAGANARAERRAEEDVDAIHRLWVLRKLVHGGLDLLARHELADLPDLSVRHHAQLELHNDAEQAHAHPEGEGNQEDFGQNATTA